jgi:hypothetical protein
MPLFDNFFFFSPIFGLKQQAFGKKLFFCLVVRGVYPPYTLSGSTTKLSTISYVCLPLAPWWQPPKPEEQKTTLQESREPHIKI